MKVLAAILAGTLLAASAPAAAQSVNDVQCIILGNLFANQGKDAQQQKVAGLAVYFYLGRVKDSMTSAQLKALMESSGKGITDANAGPKMTECVKAIQDKVQLLQSLAPAQAVKPGQPQPAKPSQPSQPQGR